MRTIFHTAMFGGLVAVCSIGLVGCGSSNASSNKMSGGAMNGDKMGDNMMSNEKMSGDKMGGEKMAMDKMGGDKMGGGKMAMDKMSGDKMTGKMANDQSP